MPVHGRLFSLHQSKSRPILIERYSAVADGIALLFSGYVEVIIHELESQSVVYIANNVSKRRLGDPSSLDDVAFSAADKVIGPYEKLNWDGQNIRSTSVVLRDDDGEAVGMLCINMRIFTFEALYEEGAFKGKSAPNYVASVLNMGRATVFKYLRDIKIS